MLGGGGVLEQATFVELNCTILGHLKPSSGAPSSLLKLQYKLFTCFVFGTLNSAFQGRLVAPWWSHTFGRETVWGVPSLVFQVTGSQVDDDCDLKDGSLGSLTS